MTVEVDTAAAASYQDWSAASVFGSTNAPPPLHAMSPSTPSQRPHRTMCDTSTPPQSTAPCIMRCPTPPPRRVIPHASPRLPPTHHTSVVIAAAAILIQRSMRLGFFRRKADQFAAQVDGMTHTLQDMAVRTMQSSFRRHRDKSKRQKRITLDASRSRVGAWMVGRWRRKQFLHALELRRQEQDDEKHAAARRVQQWWRRHHFHHHRQTIAATKIQCKVRGHAVRRQRVVTQSCRHGAVKVMIQIWAAHQLHRGFSRLSHYMERERTRQRDAACLNIQRLFRGFHGRRIAQDVRRRRFQCSNCGLVEPGGCYCKGCGRPKGKGGTTKTRKAMSSVVPECASSPRLSLAPVAGLGFRTTVLPLRPERTTTSMVVVDSTKRRAEVIDVKERLRGDKAKRMMQRRLLQSNQYLHQASAAPGSQKGCD